MDQITLAMISAIGGLIGAFGAAFAAFAAFRSAGVAKTAVDQASKSEKKRNFSNAVQAAQRVVAEHSRVIEMGGRLKGQYQTLFTFAGGTGSSRLQFYLGRIEDTEAEIATFEQSAAQWLSTAMGQINDPPEIVENKLYEFSGYLARLEALKEGFREEMVDLEKQNQTYREQALSRIP